MAKQDLDISKDEQGFTLFELLIVTSILMVLAGIAITAFNGYKKKGFDSLAKSDLRHAIIASESLYADVRNYSACHGVPECESVLPGFIASKLSDGSPALEYLDIEITDDGFIAAAKHRQSDTVFQFNNSDSVFTETDAGMFNF